MVLNTDIYQLKDQIVLTFLINKYLCEVAREQGQGHMLMLFKTTNKYNKKTTLNQSLFFLNETKREKKLTI